MGQAAVKRVVTTVLWGDNPICAALKERGRRFAACLMGRDGLFDFPSDVQQWDVLILPDDSCAHTWVGFPGDGQLLWLQHQGSGYLKDQRAWINERFPNLEKLQPAGFSHDDSGRATYLNHVAAMIRSAGKNPDEYERACGAFDAAVLRLDSSERAVSLLYSVAMTLWDLSPPELRAAAAESAHLESEVLAQRVPGSKQEWINLLQQLDEVSARDGRLDESDRNMLEAVYRDVQNLLAQHLIGQ